MGYRREEINCPVAEKKKTQQPSSGKKTPKEVKQYCANIASRSTQVDSGWWKFCATTCQQLIRVYLFVLLVKNQGVQQEKIYQKTNHAL